MPLEKITTQQMDAKGVCAAPDILNGTPAQNKSIFDRMVRELIAPAYNDAVDAIAAIEQTESSIEAAEALRVAAENLRASAETARAQAESGRVTAEEARATAESLRASAEQARAAAEQNRVAAEQGRSTAEQARAASETGRASAETARDTAEQERVAAEQARADENTGIVARATEQADLARSAAASAGNSATAAAASKSAAASSASSAAGSAAAASTSETNAKASETAAKAYETAASGSSSSAQESAAAASASASEASASATAAAASETSAVEAKTAAETAKTEAGKSASVAKASETATASSKTAAETAASTAMSAKTAAETAKTDAVSAQAKAEGAAADAAESAAAAAQSATQAAANSKAAESWAVGGTGTREGEDINNAKYWCENAQAIAGGGVTSFNGRGGIVKPQKGDYTAEMVGADASGAAAAVQSNLDGHTGNTTVHITAAERTKWNGKQDKLTFDAAPTANSTNPVTSGGVYTALANKLNKAGDGSSVTAAFTAASSRTNIATGEKLSVLFGKIAKWLSDLGSLAFKSTVAKTDLASDVQTSLGKADSALQSVTKSSVGLGNVDNVKQYSASNPPPYPVTSVNGQTGAVTVQSGSETNSYTATLLSYGWAAYGKYKKQTVTVTGLKESYPVAPVVDAQLSGTDADGDAAILNSFAAVNIVQTAENQLIAYCIGDQPTTNIPLIINTWG